LWKFRETRKAHKIKFVSAKCLSEGENGRIVSNIVKRGVFLMIKMIDGGTFVKQ
jgi:hypothetical protein